MFGMGKDKSVQEGLYAVATSIIIAAIIISFSVVYSGNIIAGNDLNIINTGNTQPQAQPQQPSAGDDAKISADDDAVKGNANAPVTIIEFSEFQCPFCGRFARDTLPSIIKDYVDTGKVKFVYRDFVVHSSSQKAQEAAECAGDQNKYWEYHDIVYQNQGALDDESLKKYATDIGLNIATFNSCFDSRKHKAEVEKDTAAGRSAGVSGTPTFFINGNKFVGAQPYSKFKTEIDAALSG